MAIQLSTPLYGFIQMTEPDVHPDCMAEPNTCLPMYAPSDLSFQIVATVSGSDRTWFQTTNADKTNSIWARFCTDCEPPANWSAWAMSYRSTWQKLSSAEIGGDTVDTWVGTFTWNSNNTPFSQIAYGECFTLCFYRVRYFTALENGSIESVTTTLIACTETCIQKIQSTCNTSVLAFRCHENSMGYYYILNNEALPALSVRLNVYARNMQFKAEGKSYQRSGGTFLKRGDRVYEEYELVVDFYSAARHKQIKIALSHDETSIDNENAFEFGVPVGFVCDEAYEIGWAENFNFALAPAKTKIIKKENLYSQNLNCS